MSNNFKRETAEETCLLYAIDKLNITNCFFSAIRCSRCCFRYPCFNFLL